VLVKINAEKEGKEMAKEFTVAGYPTFVVTDAEGTTMGRWIGYGKKAFLARTAESLADLTPFEEKLARYEADPNSADAAKLGRYHDSRGEYFKARSFYEAAQRLNVDPEADYAMPIFEATFYGHRKDVFSFEELTANADRLYASEKVKAPDMILAARMMVYAAKGAKTPQSAVPYLKIAVERTEESKDEEVLKGRRRVLPDYALLVLNDRDLAVRHKKASLSEGWESNPGDLNSFAWWCFENNLNLEEAQAMAEKGVELAEPGAAKAQILDTLAEICNAREDCRRAVEIIRQAIEEDPEKEHYRKQLERFQKLLAEQQGEN
jgi:tetratricopeptide (TPR) repeat protein